MLQRLGSERQLVAGGEDELDDLCVEQAGDGLAVHVTDQISSTEAFLERWAACLNSLQE